MVTDLDHLTISEALPVFYDKYDLKLDGGFNDKTVEIRVMKGITLYMPNFEARKKVVQKHDMHHLLTGYSAVMKGETEVSSWELSTGCTHNFFAFSINTLGMLSGVPFNLKGIWKAWARGRQTRNLYHQKYTIGGLMERRVGDLKQELGLLPVQDQKNPIGALLSFTGFLIFAILFGIASAILIPFMLLYSLFVAIQLKWMKNK